MLKNGYLIICLLTCIFCHSQDLSNKGRDFWITYPAHVDGTSSVMGVYITADEAASGSVQVGGTTIPFSIAANSVKTVFIGPNGNVTNTGVYLSQTDGITTNAGIHVTSNRPVVVYGHIIKQFRSGASLLLPSTVWGKEYIVPSYQSSGQSGPNSGVGTITIVARDTNTVVEINPRANTVSGRPAGTVYSVLLSNPGDVYQVQFQKDADISGTTVRSIATGNATCKPIGVFSSSTWSAFDCVAANGGDNLFQQLFPVRSFGKSFLTAPFINRNYDILRVFVADPATIVKRTENGVTTLLTGLQKSSFYEFKTNLPNMIEADKPISVVQYITSQNCFTNSVPADPEMIILSPLEQTINNITVFSAHQKFVPAGQSNVNKCFLNIIIKTGAAASFTINGVKPNGSFVPIPGTGYAYLSEDVSVLSSVNPVQTLLADSSFSAIAYGYGNVESYGYNAGTNVRDLYQYITIKNQKATINFPATCVNTPFEFGITLPYLATKLTWSFNGKFPNVTINNPVPDSSFVFDNKTLNLYRLKQIYSYESIGSFPVSVTATNPSSDGCNGEQQIDYDVEVYEKPAALFTWSHSGCVTDPIQFKDSSNGMGATVNRWSWQFGDNTIDSVKNPVKHFNSGGTYSIKESIITEVGCLADTTFTIDLSSRPVAGFNIIPPYCSGSSIRIDDASVISQGTIAKWYWDFGNGIKDTTTTNSPRTVVYTSGNYTISLMVESITGCKSELVTKNFTVTEAPLTDFKLPGVVCLPAGQAVFTNQTAMANGSANGIKYRWEFGDGKTDTSTNPIHSYQSQGKYTVRLIATSSNGCIKDTSKGFTEVFAQPKANFNTPPPVCLGDSSGFKDASPVTNLAISNYGWDFGNGKMDSIQNPTITYTVAATFQVSHWIISDKGCMSDTAVKSFTVNPLPSALFSVSTPVCETKQVTITDQSVANAGTITRWQWNLGDGTVRNETNGNPFQNNYSVTGNRKITLVVTSSSGCTSDTVSKTILVNALPVPGFITPEVCLSDAYAQFTDSSSISDGSGGQFSYLWNFGDPNSNAGNPNTATQKDSRHRYSLAGNYTVSLSVTSKDGCMATLTKNFTVNGDKPKADFDILNPANLCSNKEVEIVNRSTVNFGSITKTEIYWEWPSTLVKSTDENPFINKVYQHRYPTFNTPASRTYNIRLLAYSGGVCVSEIIKTVTSNAVPRLLFEQVPGFCPNDAPRTVTQVSTIGNLAGIGLFSGNGISPGGLFDPTAARTGTQIITYRFTTSAGCTDSANQNITVWPEPVASFNMNAPACAGAPLSFSDSSKANFGKTVLWSWTFGDGASQNRNNGNAFNKVYTSTGTFQAQLQITTDSGCISKPATKTVTVHHLPAVDFEIPSVCVNTPATFTDLSSIADGSESQFTYNWDFGIPGGTATVRNPAITYTNRATYTVQLKVSSKEGCLNEKTKLINNINPQPLANFEFNPGQVCLGTSISFVDKSNALSQGITNWYWNYGDDSISNLQHNSHSYKTAGTFSVSFYYTTAKGCFSDTISKNIVVNPYPVVNAGPDQFILQGGQKTLMATVSGSTGYTYSWSPATWLNNPNSLQPVASPTSDITYTLTVTAEGGCKASDEVLVKFVNAPVIPNAFSPNGDGINDVWGIKYLDSYPGSSIKVFDRFGRQVYIGNGSSRLWDGNLNGKPLPVGVYYYVIDPKNGIPVITGSLTIIR